MGIYFLKKFLINGKDINKNIFIEKAIKFKLKFSAAKINENKFKYTAIVIKKIKLLKVKVIEKQHFHQLI